MEDPRIQALIDQLDTFLLLLERPVVVWQLLAFAVVFILALLLPAPLEIFIRRLQDRYGSEQDRPVDLRDRLLRYARGVESLFFPILGLVFNGIAIDQFAQRGIAVGLLERLNPIFWLILIYRMVYGLLFAVLAPETALNYQRRFVRPLFLVLILISLTTGMAGTFTIFELELLTWMETPLTLTSITTSLIILYMFIALAWMVRDILTRFILPRTEADPGVTNTVSVTSHYAIIAIGVLIAANSIGFDLSALAIIFGGLSVGIGFGLQELVANFISGILLLFERTLRPGDVVEVGGNRGVVGQLRMRATVLRTFDNVEIFVPNKTLLTSPVSTYTHNDRTTRRTINVGVSYDSDPRQVRDILDRITTSHGLVMKDPAPMILFTAFGESSLDFIVNIWIADISDALRVLSDIHFMIFSEFKKAGIEIPFPQRDLHVRTSVPIESQVARAPHPEPNGTGKADESTEGDEAQADAGTAPDTTGEEGTQTEKQTGTGKTSVATRESMVPTTKPSLPG
ncbi:MAG: mechanosensitive ion channel domain-containing protein [Litorilinea sp.]